MRRPVAWSVALSSAPRIAWIDQLIGSNLRLTTNPKPSYQ
jgi:hypothetical protein